MGRIKKYKTEQEIKEAKRLANKKYRDTNQEKIKEYNKVNPDKNKLWVQSNPDYHKKYYDTNKERDKEKNNERAKQWNKNNPEKVIEKNKRRSKESINEYNKKRYNSNPKKANEASKKWRDANPEKKKEYDKTYSKNRNLTDPLFKLSGRVRSAINQAIKRGGYSKYPNTHTEDILECTFEHLKNYIETQWSLQHNLNENHEVWMSWENHGKHKKNTSYYGWDIDHIIPLSSAKTEEKLLELCKHTNLQPLCSYINREIKKDKVNFSQYLHQTLTL